MHSSPLSASLIDWSKSWRDFQTSSRLGCRDVSRGDCQQAIPMGEIYVAALDFLAVLTRIKQPGHPLARHGTAASRDQRGNPARFRMPSCRDDVEAGTPPCPRARPQERSGSERHARARSRSLNARFTPSAATSAASGERHDEGCRRNGGRAAQKRRVRNERLAALQSRRHGPRQRAAARR